MAKIVRQIRYTSNRPSAKPCFVKKHITNDKRVGLALRAGCIPGEQGEADCEWCGTKCGVDWRRGRNGKILTDIRFDGLEVDHVIPEFLGGDSELENLALSCKPCNRARGYRGRYQPERMV